MGLYYRGFGYYEIPKKAPGETGIIDHKEMTEEDMRLADFAAWVKEVYNPECDRRDFDDDEISSIDNVYSPDFVYPQHPDFPKLADAEHDVRNWVAEVDALNEVDLENGVELSEEQQEYRDSVGKMDEYEII